MKWLIHLTAIFPSHHTIPHTSLVCMITRFQGTLVCNNVFELEKLLPCLLFQKFLDWENWQGQCKHKFPLHGLHPHSLRIRFLQVVHQHLGCDQWSFWNRIVWPSISLVKILGTVASSPWGYYPFEGTHNQMILGSWESLLLRWASKDYIHYELEQSKQCYNK